MRVPVCLMLLGVACGAGAQDLAIYDDALRNGFQDYSYGPAGSVSFTNPTPFHDGAPSIRLSPDNFNAIAFAHPTQDFTTTQYVGVRFYVHGGVAGGQQLRIALELGDPSVTVDHAELDTYVAGGAIVANAWSLVEVRFADAPLSFSGSFDRINIASDVGGTQGDVFIDDVELIAAAPLSPFIFSDGFEGTGAPGPTGDLRFTTAAFGVGEAAGNATISVERVNGSTGPVSVTYGTSADTALSPDDYATTSGMLSWSSGESGTRTFNVAIVNDATDEPDETLNLALSGATGGATLVAPTIAVLTIIDDDLPPPSGTLSFDAASGAVPESAGITTVNVVRSGGSAGAVSVVCTPSDGTATSPADYTATVQTLNWNNGDANPKTCAITVVDDGFDEPDEDVSFTLSGVSGAALGSPSTRTLTIQDNDVPPPAGILSFQTASSPVDEAAGAIFVNVIRSGGSAGAVSVLCTPSDGSATSPADYTAAPQILNWSAGDASAKPCNITIAEDLLDEPDEVVNFTLSAASGGAMLGAQSTRTLTIVDNDVPPSFSINDVTLNEGNAGVTAFTFTVTRGGGLATTDTVQVQSADQSAVSGIDYAALPPTTLTFAPNVTTQTATVNVSGDIAFEPNETFFANLSNASSGTITDAQGVGTIVNDDAAPVAGQVRFSAATYRVGEADGSVTITVQRVGGSDGVISVDYATSNAMAVAPGDYTSAAGTLTWVDGDAAPQTFNVAIVDDGVAESDETVGLNLTNPVGTALAAPSAAVLTIVEPELMFVPQYQTSQIKVYRRGAGNFVLINTATLAGTLPNALAFAPDGKLWVVDNNSKRLLRYGTQSVVTQTNPVAEIAIGPVGNSGDVIDMAFFGNFAYVTQSGATQRVLKFALADLAAGINASTVLSDASLSVPAGLEFDAQGRLWISNYGNNTLVRMNTNTGAIDRTVTQAALGPRLSLNLPEGLAFDTNDSLWVGNNGEPTISGYAEWQLAGAGSAATVPVHQIDVNPALFQSDTVGGLAFDRDGDLWANYQKTLSVLEYVLVPGPRAGGLPGVGSYTSTPGQVLGTATTNPGFGGIAIWPVPATTRRTAATFRGTNVVGMEMGYSFYDQGTGPIGGTHYPVHDTRLIDYFAGKGMTTIRFLFSWEPMQSTLGGPIPASNAGNYKLYFDRYKNIVDYATNVKGMQVIVEPWQADPGGGAGGPRWRGNLVGAGVVSITHWMDFWTKFAGIFAANPRVSFGLINEPNNMSTMGWWAIAQAGVTAIRNSGATQRIYVPGNGYSAASTWVIGNAFYDTDAIKRSNAYGYLNANGVGNPITDPMNNMAVEVHTYLDPDQGGSSDEITSVTAARQHMTVVVDEARRVGYKVYLGELGFLATKPLAPAAWADFIAYFEANQDVFIGFTWWAGGAPAWWDDIGATGGGHYAITPLDDAAFTGDTVNMNMIENDF